MSHIAPSVKSPPQYRVACNAPPPEVPLDPQGQSTTDRTPILVSGQLTVKLRLGSPDGEGMIVGFDRQPSIQ